MGLRPRGSGLQQMATVGGGDGSTPEPQPPPPLQAKIQNKSLPVPGGLDPLGVDRPDGSNGQEGQDGHYGHAVDAQ
jgi:hypothetical protein